MLFPERERNAERDPIAHLYDHLFPGSCLPYERLPDINGLSSLLLVGPEAIKVLTLPYHPALFRMQEGTYIAQERVDLIFDKLHVGLWLEYLCPLSESPLIQKHLFPKLHPAEHYGGRAYHQYDMSVRVVGVMKETVPVAVIYYRVLEQLPRCEQPLSVKTVNNLLPQPV